MSQAEIDAITESGGPKPQFAGNEVLTATNLNLATRHWVTTEVPGDHLGNDGDIAFVAGGAAPNSELPGIGGWAELKEVSGTFTKHPYGDWVAYEWTGDGELVTDGGLVDALIVNSGATSYGGTGGRGGNLLHGLYDIPENSTVVLGNLVGRGVQPGSALGDISPGERPYFSGTLPISSGGAGPEGWNAQTQGPGFLSSITGTPVEYSCAYKVKNGTTDFSIYAPGDGGEHNGSNPGTQEAMPGVVIVRVPAANAQNVTENFFRWISYATVENGVVTKVTKTPDNKPYTASAQEVECDASVQEGYLYENGEFAAPEPDYSDEIAALTDRLEELRNV